jgi:hypothetical protein
MFVLQSFKFFIYKIELDNLEHDCGDERVAVSGAQYFLRC